MRRKICGPWLEDGPSEVDRLSEPKEEAAIAEPKGSESEVGAASILIPLDRTVASLQGKRELVLVKKSMLPQLGHDLIQVAGKTTDPNGEWWLFIR